ncbi:MAG: homoserine O-acetyltransferase [Spirochaetia bacterium]|nr:homoserine O-acetyltransferase [Spirochaetia bacterium]
MKENTSYDLQDQKIKNYHSDLGITHTKTVTLPGIRTQSGYEFKKIDLNFMTIGTLNPEKSNAVLVCHALSGDAYIAGINPETGRPGWWDFHVGPGKAIDTDKFFVIASNVIGGCNGSTGPSSINPETNKRFGMSFPQISIRDMVAAQKRLLDFLGIEKLFSVVGGSMGGMQALIWALDYPEMVTTCIPIATSMAHSAMQIAFNEVGRQAILTDPNWKNGDYYDQTMPPDHGLAVARMIGHITYLSEYSMKTKFGRKLQRVAEPEEIFPLYSIESYLHYQGESFVKRFDPNTYLFITKAIDMFDFLEDRPHNEVLRNIRSRFLVISFESDWLYPPGQSKELVKALKRSNATVTYCNLGTQYGHDSFLINNPEFSRIMKNFLHMEYMNQESISEGDSD